MRDSLGILKPHQRLLAWIGFLALSGNAPVIAYAVPTQDWMLSVTVAGITAAVLVIDDRQRRRTAPAAEPDE